MNNMANHKNNVELIGWYGGDKAIARAAWTSTQIDVDAKTDEQGTDPAAQPPFTGADCM